MRKAQGCYCNTSVWTAATGLTRSRLQFEGRSGTMTKSSDDLNVVSNRLFEQVLCDAVTVWDRAAVFEHAGRCFHQLPPAGIGINVNSAPTDSMQKRSFGLQNHGLHVAAGKLVFSAPSVHKLAVLHGDDALPRRVVLSFDR